jgi:hypothetical protein
MELSTVCQLIAQQQPTAAAVAHFQAFHQCKRRTELLFFKLRPSGLAAFGRRLKSVTGTFTDKPALKVRD